MDGQPTEPDSDADTYRTLAPNLIRYATLLVGPCDAPDVVADAFLAAMTGPRWAEVQNRRAYLYRVTTSKVSDLQRSTSRRRQRESEAGRELARAWTGSARPEIVTAIAELSSRQRAVVHLTYWDDLTPAAVADVLGISDGAVRRHLARARAHLRAELRPLYQPQEDRTHQPREDRTK